MAVAIEALAIRDTFSCTLGSSWCRRASGATRFHPDPGQPLRRCFSTQILDSMLASTPAGKLGNNEEVSDVIAFLCSSAAR